MHKIAGAGATAQNTFTKGDPATGVPATEVTQEWLNTMQAELVYLVEQAGLTLDSANDTQIKAAIDTLIAAGASTPSPSILPVSASVAASALTISMPDTPIDFRSATLSDGAVSNLNSGALSFTVSSGSTLGTVNAIQSRIAILAINNAGTVELAVVNLAGGNNLDETTLISTVAEGGAGAADLANVIYSATARTNVPFRVVGYVESTQATAGTWASAPTTVQGAGGNALTALGSIGFGQTEKDVSASRAFGVTYYNNTGKPFKVNVRGNSTTLGTTSLTVNGKIMDIRKHLASDAVYCMGSDDIPPDASYSMSISAGTPTNVVWMERS